MDAAREGLKALPPVDSSTDIPVATAEVGDVSTATAELQKVLHEHPNDTLWQYFRGPQIKAAIALANKQPEAAVEALKVSTQYETRNSEIPSLRGQAYLALNQPQAAIAEFHKVIDHPGIEPLTPNFALAHLGIARALSLEGNHAGSRAEYEQFFACWKHADADLPVLGQARLEYAQQ
jgi:eukaryotic-like serine/threonine-protein kinase